MTIIACLQFAPQRGKVEHNIDRANEIIRNAKEKFNLLVLPECAFSGSDFPTLASIHPFLEYALDGQTSLWASKVAHDRNCIVIAGYPETVDISLKWPTSDEYYSSVVAANADGEFWNCRKSFVDSANKIWALESEHGLFCEEIEGLGNVAMGIGTDLNQDAQGASNTWNFASHILRKEAKLVILSMLSSIPTGADSHSPKDPDLRTLSEWLARLEPIIRDDTKDEIICVFANRIGTEGNMVYTGTSAVLGLRYGEVHVYGMLGNSEEGLLIADTCQRAERYVIKKGSTVSIVDAAQKFFATEEIPEPPSWLRPTTKGQIFAVVSMGQGKSNELDRMTLDYLCKILWAVNPRYLLVLKGEPEHKLELNRLSQMEGTWEKGIAAIHYWAPSYRVPIDVTMLEFRHQKSIQMYVLYGKITRKQHEPNQHDSEQSSIDKNPVSSMPGPSKEPLPDVADTGNQNIPNVEEDNGNEHMHKCTHTMDILEKDSKDEVMTLKLVIIPHRPKSPKSWNTLTKSVNTSPMSTTPIDDSPITPRANPSSSIHTVLDSNPPQSPTDHQRLS